MSPMNFFCVEFPVNCDKKNIPLIWNNFEFIGLSEGTCFCSS